MIGIEIFRKLSAISLCSVTLDCYKILETSAIKFDDTINPNVFIVILQHMIAETCLYILLLMNNQTILTCFSAAASLKQVLDIP